MANILKNRHKYFVSIEDLNPYRFFIKLDDSFNELMFSKLVSKYPSMKEISKQLDVSLSSIYSWKKSRQYPLYIILHILKETKIEIKKLEHTIISIKSGFKTKNGGGGVSQAIFPVFPINFSKELFRIIAHTFGDGCLSIAQNGNITHAYYNQEKLLRDNIKQDIRVVFGNINLNEGINKTTPFVSIPVPISLILLSKIKVFNGTRCIIPDFILNSKDNAFKIEFIKSIFDDEAHVRYDPPHRRVELALSNELFLKQIRNILLEFNIGTTNIYYYLNRDGYHKYYFYIRNFHNIKLFYDKIGFNHPKKLRDLKMIISNPGRKHYATGETESLIISNLAKKPGLSKDLSRILFRNKSTINYWLYKLENKGKVKRNGFRKLKKRSEIIWGLK
ncbi:MAG TPA: LAGLIDADG family homing endonuclease [Candidatus Nanoarchaeia archaeon]|nr:LAGLIDADG family homing endonuclease [Candidatus Nanoarchaeia archaeon]